jgi:hypothetical protein
MDPLHGYCAVGCIDNGTNSPTSQNPPVNFGFTISPGPQTGDLLIDILTPNNQAATASSFTLTGTLSGTATSFSASLFNSGNLDAFLGISAAPNSPIGGFIDPNYNTVNPGATGFHVFQADLGTATLQDASMPNVSPLENLNTQLPLGSYIVAFLNIGTAANPDWVATALSGAILDTSIPTSTTKVVITPEPSTLGVLGTALAMLGFIWRRRKSV